MFRRITVILIAIGLVLGGTACSPKDDGTATAAALAAALATHTAGGLAFDTATADVQRELTGLAEGLAPVWPEVTVDGVEVTDNTAKVSLKYAWELPHQDKPWSYATQATMAREGDGWVIAWSPEMIAPDLKAGERLKLTTTFGQRATILDAEGAAIVKDRPVRVVGINKEGLSEPDALAAAKQLAALLGIDEKAYLDKVKAYGPVAFVDALTLRSEAFDALDQAKLKVIPGILATSGTLPLAPSRTFAASLLGSVHQATAEDIEKSEGRVVAGQMVGSGGLQAAFNEQLSGTPGVSIAAVPGAGEPSATASATDDGGTSPEEPVVTERLLYSVDAVAGRDVKTTLVPSLQSAAEKALAAVTSPSSVVVMRPSTGAILASANGPESQGYNTAFLGQYAPGSTFKIATSLGLLRQGLTPASLVNCAPEYVADGKKFLNAPGYAPEATGQVSLTAAVAHSCNTAFVAQFEKLPQTKLADAAGALGIGMTNDLGLEAYMGNVPRDSAGTEHAASMIGQGKVQVSPLAMAAMMATLAKGQLVAPVLIDGHKGEVKAAHGAPLSAKEAADLRTMMRAVVTDGYLGILGDLPGAAAIGKTGTAEYGNQTPPRTHSWVIAAQGDVAVAVFVEDGDLGAVTAGPIARAMLAAAG